MTTIEKEARTVKVKFDPELQVSSRAGLALLDRLISRIGLPNILEDHLPPRPGKYSSAVGALQLIYGLMAGGRGLSAAEVIRQDSVLTTILGFDGGVAEEATMTRIMTQMAGLELRSEKDWYDLSKRTHSQTGIFKEDKIPSNRRRGKRIVKGVEYMKPENRERVREAETQTLLKLLSGTKSQFLIWNNRWNVVFGDGTLTEVQGKCTDGAQKRDHNGNRSLLWHTVWLGPYLAAQELFPGNTDEGVSIPPLIETTDSIIRQSGVAKHHPVLALLDSAFAERQVLERLQAFNWQYIIGANTHRKYLEKGVKPLAEDYWQHEAKPPAGYSSVAYTTMKWQAKTWLSPERVVAIRHIKEKELLPTYSFIITSLKPEDVQPEQERFGTTSFEATIWAMYSHKQARENNHKTPLSDMGLHHPPSGRMGVNQVFYSLGAIATNLAVAISSSMPKPFRAIRLWRLRQLFFTIAGTVSIRSRYAAVKLATAVSLSVQKAWLGAFRRVQAWI